MEDKIKIDKTARTIVEGRLAIDIEQIKKRFGGKMTKKGLEIPLDNMEIEEDKDGNKYVWLPFKGDGIIANITIPLKQLTKEI